MTPQGLRYKDVEESHGEGDTHSLTCANGGDKVCCWRIDPPGRQMNINMEEVHYQVSLGNFNGSFTTTTGNIVTWTGTSVFNFNIKVCQP